MNLAKSLTNLTLLLTLYAFSPLGYAEDPEDEYGDDLADFYGDEDFVSIATGTKKLIRKAPAVASIITAEDIRNMGANSLNEVLERVPSLHVTLSNLSRYDPVFSIRGIQTGFNPQVLVLLNGTEFKNSGNGGLPFIFYLPLIHIERIEVIRGPGSAVYGADAFSGVINIITDQSLEKEVSFGGKVGSFSSNEAWFRVANNLDTIKYSVAVDWLKTDGDHSRVVESDLQSTLDQIFMTSASNAPGFLPTNRNILNIFADAEIGNVRLENWFWRQNDGGLGPGGAQALDFVGTQDVALYRTKLIYKDKLLTDSNYSVDLSRLIFDHDSLFSLLPSGTVVPIGSDGNLNFVSPAGFTLFTDGVLGKPGGRHTDDRFNLIFNLNEWVDHKYRFSLGWLKQDVNSRELKNFGPGVIDGSQPIVNGVLTDVSNTSNVYLPDISRTARYASVQDEWAFANDWELTLGLRYDDYSDFGNAINPRAALVWQTAYNITTKLLYGKAFRPPSFIELKLQNNPVSLGNINLVEEDIDTYELAFDYRLNPEANFQLSIFNYQAHNIIDVVPDQNSPTRTYQNTRNQNGNGYEFLVDWSLTKRLEASFNYSYQSIRARSQLLPGSSFVPVADIPNQSFYLSLDFTFNDEWRIDSQSFLIHDRRRQQGDPRENIKDYSNTNVNLRFLPSNSKWKFSAAIKNIGDQEQREPSDGTIANDYPLEKRSFWLSFDFQM